QRTTRDSEGVEQAARAEALRRVDLSQRFLAPPSSVINRISQDQAGDVWQGIAARWGWERSFAPWHRSSNRRSAPRDHFHQRAAGLVLLPAFLISIFCCFFATSAGFGKWMCNTPLSNFASTFAGSGSKGKGIARLNEP